MRLENDVMIAAEAAPTPRAANMAGRREGGRVEGDSPAVICFPFAGGTAGGSHISVIGLIHALDRRAFTPLVLLHHGGGQVAELLRAEGIDFEIAPSPHHFGRSPGVRGELGLIGYLKSALGQLALARFLRKRRVRIVHTNEGPMHISWALPAWLAGAKLLWHHRSSPEARGLRYLAPLLADRIVSVSRFAAPDRPCDVIYSPFDTEMPQIDRVEARRRLIDELGVPDDTFVIGYFGNFTDRKRPLLFVETIAAIRDQAPDIPVVGVMFGSTLDEGLDQKTLALAAELGVADRIRLMGFRYPGEQWIAACDLTLVTAVGEPFGRSLIEAMLLGTPIVAVDCGGNPEAIRDGETGLLAPPDDAPAIAARTIALLRDRRLAADIAVNARRDALDRFGRARHGQQVSGVYRQLLGAAPCAD